MSTASPRPVFAAFIVANRPDLGEFVPRPPRRIVMIKLSRLRQNTRSSCVSTRLLIDGRCSLNCAYFSPLRHSKSVLKQHFSLNFDRVLIGGVVNRY